MFSEGLNVNQVRLKDVQNIRDNIGVSRESFSDRLVKCICVLLLKPRFHCARLAQDNVLALRRRLSYELNAVSLSGHSSCSPRLARLQPASALYATDFDRRPS